VYADYYVFETTLKEQPEEEEETLGADTVQIVANRMVQLHVESHYMNYHCAYLAMASLSCSIFTTLVDAFCGCWFLKLCAARWSCLTLIDKAQNQFMMFLQMSCSAAHVFVASSVFWLSVLSFDFAKQTSE